MKISVAIPNYKNHDSLVNLIDQLSDENFHQIYVLDDCSPNLSEIQKSLKRFNNVQLIPSSKRLLTTKNRNRVLELDMGEVVLFLDSDLIKVSDNICDNITNVFTDEKIAILGGQILENGKPLVFGYGMGPFWPIDQSWLFGWTKPISWRIYQLLSRIYEHKIPKQPVNVTWLAEGVMAVRSSVFKLLGGFDANFDMYHEGPDLCVRARKLGYRVVHSPIIKFDHLHIQHFSKENIIIRSTAYWFYKHHGWPKWLANFMFFMFKYQGRDIDQVES